MTLNTDASNIRVMVDVVPPSLRPKRVPARKRGGVPYSHGEYTGVRAAKRAAKEAEKQDEKEAANEAISQFAKDLRSTRQARAKLREGENSCSSSSGEEAGGKPAKVLVGQIGEEVALIEEVATKSKNLKGTSVRALKEAAKSVRSIAYELGKLKRTTKTGRLKERTPGSKRAWLLWRRRWRQCGVG